MKRIEPKKVILLAMFLVAAMIAAGCRPGATEPLLVIDQVTAEAASTQSNPTVGRSAPKPVVNSSAPKEVVQSIVNDVPTTSSDQLSVLATENLAESTGPRFDFSSEENFKAPQEANPVDLDGVLVNPLGFIQGDLNNLSDSLNFDGVDSNVSDNVDIADIDNSEDCPDLEDDDPDDSDDDSDDDGDDSDDSVDDDANDNEDDDSDCDDDIDDDGDDADDDGDSDDDGDDSDDGDHNDDDSDDDDDDDHDDDHDDDLDDEDDEEDDHDDD